MIRNKMMLVGLFVFSMQSMHAMMPVARISALALAKTPAGAGIVSTATLAGLHLGIRHFSVVSEFLEDKVPGGKKVNELSLRAHENMKTQYAKLQDFMSRAWNGTGAAEVTQNNEFVANQLKQQAAPNNAWIGGQGGSVTNIGTQHINQAPTTFWDLFKHGSDKAKIGLGFGLGSGFGYGLHCAVATKQGPQEKIIVVQVPASGQVATGAQS